MLALDSNALVIDYAARIIRLDGELYRLEGRRLAAFRVHHVDGYEVATVQITERGFSSTSVIGEKLVRAWLEHCADAGLDPWPPARRR